MTTKKKGAPTLDMAELTAMREREADAFARLANEIEDALRRGAYQSFKIDYSRKRRSPGVKIPINTSITYGDKTS